jgi:hypothetical protein
MLAAERNEALQRVEREQKRAQALLTAIQALGTVNGSAGRINASAVSRQVVSRQLSAAGRARIAAAAKKRWAKFRAAAKKSSK